MSKAFTPRAVDALRPVMRVVTHELIDSFAARGTCEFMAAFADPYPSRIICELLGIPRERYPQFHGWATDFGLAFSYTVAEHLTRIEAALQGLYACVDDLLAERRAAGARRGLRAHCGGRVRRPTERCGASGHGDGAGVRGTGHHP